MIDCESQEAQSLAPRSIGNPRTTRRLSWIDEVHMGTDELLAKRKNSLLLQRERRRYSARSSADASSESENTSGSHSSTRINVQRRPLSSSFTDSSGVSPQSDRKPKGTGIGAGLAACLQVQSEDSETEYPLAHSSSNPIKYIRLLTIIALLMATGICAGLTFILSRNAERNVFYVQYEDSVIKVAQTISTAISNKLNAAKTFSAMYTSRYGPMHPWPDVTMSNFDEQASGQLDIANGIALSFNPIIQNETRLSFEAHANKTAHMLGANELINRTCDLETNVCGRIVEDGIWMKVDGEIVDDTSGLYPMVPIWQIYPSQTNWKAVMFNLHSEINRRRALDDMLKHRVSTITALLHLVQHDEIDPSSILFYPVFNTFAKGSVFFQEVVGSISIVFTWADILRSSLPDYIKGMIVVLESSVKDEIGKQQFTYSISGNEVTLLGEGDMHDMRYHRFEHEVNTNVAMGVGGLELENVEYLITYRLRIYPSSEFEAQYLSLRPLIMMFVVISIFLLTSAIFLLYDYLVKNRQDALFRVAQRSGDLVNSMFPKGVRERLFASNDQYRTSLIVENTNGDESANRKSGNALSKSNNSKGLMRNPAYQIRKFLKGGDENKVDTGFEDPDAQYRMRNTPSIADLFPNTTIMFADLVSFTQWSSNHEPEDVFYLLETVFLEFDIIAKRMNVFKLGTIGDCYIAVTGIPDEREDHAVVMAEFAQECRIRMYFIINELISVFGPSANNLSMRFGVHSGPITAGVLRGMKPRFELFGDTINTASRMESTGVRDKIQVSEQTATILRQKGYGKWLTPRDGLVDVKGKGLLQTYWLDETNGRLNEKDGNNSNKKSEVDETKNVADRKDSSLSFTHQIFNHSDDVSVNEGSLSGESDTSSIYMHKIVDT